MSQDETNEQREMEKKEEKVHFQRLSSPILWHVINLSPPVLILLAHGRFFFSFLLNIPLSSLVKRVSLCGGPEKGGVIGGRPL